MRYDEHSLLGFKVHNENYTPHVQQVLTTDKLQKVKSQVASFLEEWHKAGAPVKDYDQIPMKNKSHWDALNTIMKEELKEVGIDKHFPVVFSKPREAQYSPVHRDTSAGFSVVVDGEVVTAYETGKRSWQEVEEHLLTENDVINATRKPELICRQYKSYKTGNMKTVIYWRQRLGPGDMWAQNLGGGAGTWDGTATHQVWSKEGTINVNWTWRDDRKTYNDFDKYAKGISLVTNSIMYTCNVLEVKWKKVRVKPDTKQWHAINKVSREHKAVKQEGIMEVHWNGINGGHVTHARWFHDCKDSMLSYIFDVVVAIRTLETKIHCVKFESNDRVKHDIKTTIVDSAVLGDWVIMKAIVAGDKSLPSSHLVASLFAL